MPFEQRSNFRDWRTWRLICDHCARSWWTALTDEAMALAAAHANGWDHSDQRTLCPACATGDVRPRDRSAPPRRARDAG